MLKKIVLLIALTFLLVLPNVNAATLSVSVDGLDSLLPDGIITYEIHFAVGGDWEGFTESSNVSWDADPTWSLEANLTDENELILTGYDATYGESLLTDGLLFTITYPDTVGLTLQLTSLEFSDTSYNGVFLNASQINFGTGDNTLVFSTGSVPVPSAFLLLFTGLCSFAGLTRRQR